MWRIQSSSLAHVRPSLIHQIGNPAADCFHIHLGAFLLQKGKHVEVAVAFGKLCPKLTRDLDDGLHARVVHFDLAQALTGEAHRCEELLAVKVIENLTQRVADSLESVVLRQAARNPSRRTLKDFVTLPVLQKIAESIPDFLDRPIGRARNNLVGTDLVNHVVDHIAQVHRVELAHAEVGGEFQAGITGHSIDTMVLLEKQDSKLSEPRILQRHSILGLVGAEAARPAGSRSNKNVIGNDFLAGKTSCFLRPQELDEVADGEVSRIALAVVAILLAGLEGGHVGVRQPLEAIAAAAKHGFNEALVFPGKASEKNGDAVAFFRGEGPLQGAVEVLDGFLDQPRSLLQPRPLRQHAASDLFFPQRRKRGPGGVHGGAHGFRVSLLIRSR